MLSPKMLIAAGVIILLLAAYLVYSGSVSLIGGACLVGIIACVFGMIKLGGDGAPLGRKILAGLLFVLSLGLVGLFIWQSNPFEDKWEGPNLKLKEYELARANVFASKLVDIASGSKALLLVPSKIELPAPPPPKPGQKAPPPPPRQRAKMAATSGEIMEISTLQIEELKKIFGASIEIVGVESFPCTVMPDRLGIPHIALGRDINAKAYEAAIQKYKTCNLVVSFVGLPNDTRAMTIWRWNAMARPKLAFMEGDLRRLSNFSTRGLVTLFAAYREGWTFTPDCPPDPQDAFPRRYMLVGEGNKPFQVPDPNRKPAAPATAPAKTP